jgi:hypothetical protein
MHKVMAFLSFCSRSIDRLLAVFPEWFGADKTQASVIFFGTILIAAGIICEMVSSSPDELDSRVVNQFYLNFTTNQPIPTSGSASQESGKPVPKHSWLKLAALVLISVGASIVAAGIILRVARMNGPLQASLEKAGVLFVGDRNAFDEVIGKR